MQEPPGDPTPVLELNYASAGSAQLRAVLRLVVWLFLIGRLTLVGYYITCIGGLLWEANDITTFRKLIPVVPLWIEAPRAIAALY